MSSIELAEKAMRNNQLERSWTKDRMKGDALFERLANTRRDYAYLGRLFVAWTIQAGAPVIDCLFLVDRFGVSDAGLNVTIRTATAKGDTGLLRVTHNPIKAPGLSLYFWLPHHAEVRYTPFTRVAGEQRFRCNYPLLVKHQDLIELGQKEGHTYFGAKSEFVKLWPDHDF